MPASAECILEVRKACKRFSRTVPAKRRQLIRQFSLAIAGKPDDAPQLAEDEFWALQDVSFSLDRGEALGLIGLNGSGKSTLLSIVARQTLPDRGMVRSRGQIAAMINLTAGFEDTLTGKENIFLKGALFGRSRAQMFGHFDDIVNFAEIGGFIDSPVGTYSSGMRMRLAFAVAIHTEPDLLLVDEILSVGDFMFRQKCLGKLNEFRAHSSFVFVSHSFQDIARFCTRLLVLEKGKLVFDGPTQEGLRFYRESSTTPAGYEPIGPESETSSGLAMAPLALMGNFVHRRDVIDSVSFHWRSSDGQDITSVQQGQAVVAEIRFRLLVDPNGIAISIPMWNIEGTMVTSVNSDVSGCDVRPDADGWATLEVRFDSLDLNPGEYFPVLSIGKNSEFIYRQSLGVLKVAVSYAMTWGVFTPQVRWENVDSQVARVQSLED